jgi:16S rRNA (uracil1498-N3)-methyltransferase
MTRQVFFLPSIIADKNKEIVLPPEVSHQILRVLRLGRGDVIELRDESGRSWKAEIVRVSKKLVQVALLEEVFYATESPLGVKLFLALARSDRVDLAVRQATELGVKEIILFPSARSPYRLEQPKIQDRTLRWDKIAREAVCQCRRVEVPRIFYKKDLEEVMTFVESESGDILRIVASEMNGSHGMGIFLSADVKPDTVAIAVGPEGGWTEEEIAMFESRKWIPVSLGPRILRYETAVVVMLSLCQFLWGDMK